MKRSQRAIPVAPSMDDSRQRQELLCQLKFRDSCIASLRDAPLTELRNALERTHGQPETVFLRTRDEFDRFRHYNSLIEFPPGGEVGDAEWSLQYMHNAGVLAQSRSNPIVAPDTYVAIPEDSSPDWYLVCYMRRPRFPEFPDCLLDRQSLSLLMVFNNMIDIRPEVSGLFFTAIESAAESVEYQWEPSGGRKGEILPAIIRKVPNWPASYIIEPACRPTLAS